MIGPLLIAEIGVNYYEIAERENISIVDAAKLMINKAKDSGLHVVKFQTYKAEKLAAKNSPAYWNTSEESTISQIELFRKYDKLTYDEYKVLANYAATNEIEFMSTAFDPIGLDEINKIVKRHKIASADITNIGLLEQVSSYKKPVLLSLGASNIDEVDCAIRFLSENGIQDITILHCVLCYPTPLQDANLRKILFLKKRYTDIKIGYSDHVKFDIDVLITSWLLGATVIEKHFTLDKSLKGNDHYHAGDPEDFKNITEKILKIQTLLGDDRNAFYLPQEDIARKFARRGVYLIKDVFKGEKVKYSDVEFLRPQGDGINPMQWDDLVKREATYKQSLNKDDQILKEHI